VIAVLNATAIQRFVDASVINKGVMTMPVHPTKKMGAKKTTMKKMGGGAAMKKKKTMTARKGKMPKY
tara:strand:- start:838 stop:1038 length:201 start_codon:yes stop_codon:yes gene_type:complete